jgi:hypothetical protein
VKQTIDTTFIRTLVPPQFEAHAKKRPPSRRRHRDCIDCGVDTSFGGGNGHYYTVTEAVWLQAVPKPAERLRQLCLDCLQSRLGRPLARADFVATPNEIFHRMAPAGGQIIRGNFGGRRPTRCKSGPTEEINKLTPTEQIDKLNSLLCRALDCAEFYREETNRLASDHNDMIDEFFARFWNEVHPEMVKALGGKIPAMLSIEIERALDILDDDLGDAEPSDGSG